MREIKGYLVFRELQEAGKGYFVITDITGNKIHDVRCVFVKEENFVKKVLENRGKNGSYFWVASSDEVPHRLKVQKCSHCL